jgi:hypothetical protein
VGTAPGWSGGSWPRRPFPRRERAPDVSASDPAPRTPGWRGITTATIGIVAGVGGVVVVRTFFGPRLVLAGALVGLVALTAGMAISWAASGRRGRRHDAVRLPGDRRLRRRVHPVAWLAPVVGSVVTVLAWAGVAHSSGSGWVQAVGALLAAVLFTGLVAPLFPALRARAACTASPSDTEAGRPVELTLAANGPIRIRPRSPTGPVARAEGPSRGSRPVVVTVTPERRGVLESVVVEVASCAPFGLLWWAREVEVPLSRPLHVAPRLGTPGPMDATRDHATGESPWRVPSGTGEPRGVRPFEAGDSRRSVHWPATSHVGVLMVRERERQTEEPVVIEVVLPQDQAAAEAESERVMAVVTGCLLRRQPVVLGTLEAEGRCLRLVRDRIDLGRRLARALPPEATHPPSPDGAGPSSGQRR